jgi:integrase
VHDRDGARWLDQARGDVARGQHVDQRAGRITYEEWSKRYFAAALHKRSTTAARDKVVNRRHFVPAFGARSLSSLSPLDVRTSVQRMAQTLAPSTVRTNYGALRAILNAAVDADIIPISPCRGIKLPPNRRGKLRFLSAEELGRVANAIPVQYRSVIYLAGVLGLRWSEIAGLRVGRIDFLRRSITVTETCAEVDGRVEFADVKTSASRRTLEMP